MSVALDNSEAGRRRPLVRPGATPEELARGMVAATVPEGQPRQVVQLVAQPRAQGPRDATARFRHLLQRGRFREAIDLCVRQLGRGRNEALRRLVFACLRQQEWRRRLLPVLRERVRARPASAVPGALFLFALMREDRMPRPDLTSPLVWTVSLVWLLDHVQPERVEAMARHLADAYPRITFLDDMARGLANVPPATDGPRFRDHWNADVQLVRARNPGPAPLLICFTGLFGRMGTPINTFHRWVAQENLHVLYLKDLRRRFYRDGIATLGSASEDGAVQLAPFLKTVAEELGASQVTLYGISMGGLPAVEIALEIGAGRVIWAAGAVEREDSSRAWNSEEERERRRDVARDLLRRLEAARTPPEIACIYGAGFPSDAEMPEILAAHPAVRLHPLDGLSSHNIDFHLVKAGRFERLIHWAAFGPEPLELS